MPPALPVITGKQCVKALKRAGFYIQHQRGSHIRLLHEADPARRVTVPHTTKDLLPKTLNSIIKQSGLTRDEFLALL